MQPMAWQRARINGKHFFDIQAKDKLCFSIHLQSQHDNDPLFTTAIAIDIVFYMPYKSVKKERDKVKVHCSTPDLDNLCKFALDAMKGVVFKDDRLVSHLSAKKVYDKKPRTEFTITEISDGKNSEK